MRRRLLAFASVVLVLVACESTSSGPGLQSVHPQPQPNHGTGLKFSAPCTPETCGEVPASVASPHCKPEASGCVWSDDTPVSYRGCEEAECGTAPSADVCPTGTTFRGNSCGSENDGPCRWSTACAPPPSTTPCPDPEGCGGKPELAVICADGGLGDLACMQFSSRCAWQQTCD